MLKSIFLMTVSISWFDSQIGLPVRTYEQLGSVLAESFLPISGKQFYLPEMLPSPPTRQRSWFEKLVSRLLG